MTCWLRSATGRISLFQRRLPNNTNDGYDVQAIELLERSDSTWLLAVSAQGNALNVFRIAANGQAQFAATLGAAEGLGINAANLLQCVQMGGKDYALLGAAGSGSIVVVAVGSTGKLTLVDQINDDLNTRFSALSVLETISVAGRIFVLAGGDDGLSLMTLLPNGRLLHLATVVDTLEIALSNVSVAVLTASGSGAGFDVFATGFLESRISQFRIDLGALAPIQIARAAGSTLTGATRQDLLMGGLGDNHLYGGAGDDILIDGAGQDTMHGGTGADVFVFLADGQSDTVLDFDITLDRLDLSGLGRIYSRDAISFYALAGGILLSVQGEQIRVFSSDGRAIPTAALTDALLFNLSHAPIYIPVTTGLNILGTRFSDTLLGSNYNDTLVGGKGNDLLFGGAGYDRVVFTETRPVVVNLSLTVAQDTGEGLDELHNIEFVTSGDGDDILTGSALRNSLIAGSGNDLLYGGLGNDTLTGGLGNDVMDGGDGIDLAAFQGTTALVVNLALVGGQNTGVGWDILRGIENLIGGSGNDRLSGTAGVNSLWGGGGNDTLYGGLGDDALYGGSGADRVLYSGSGAVMVNLSLTGAQNTGQGWEVLRDIEHVTSGSGNDRLIGNTRANSLIAGAGDDNLYGGLGNDSIYGGAGNDVLDGGAGNQVLLGGVGADTFVFRATDHGKSQVYDLEVGDHVRLSGYGYTSDKVALSHFKQTSQGVVFTDHLDTVLFLGSHLADFTAEMILL